MTHRMKKGFVRFYVEESGVCERKRERERERDEKAWLIIWMLCLHTPTWPFYH